MKTVVVADFDETLVHENTLIPLYKHLSTKPMIQVVARVFGSLHWLKIGLHQAIKAQMYREILAGREEKVVRDTAKEIAKTINVNECSLEKLNQYRDAGAVVVVASASLEPFVETVLEEKNIRVDRVIGSIPVQDNGIYTSDLLGGECVGKQKAERSKKVLERYYSGYRVIVLGNLPADRALMNLADEAYVVDGEDIRKYR